MEGEALYLGKNLSRHGERRKVAESKIPVDKTVKIYLELDASRKLEEKYSWLINVEIVAIPITN